MEAEAVRRVFRSLAPEATVELGRGLGRALGPGAVVALTGELGTGKTTFTRGLGEGLGVEDPVHSPSFTLMHEHEGRHRLYHFDAWMEGRETLFLEGGGAEFLGGEGVAVVEWADRVTRFLPRPRIELRLTHAGEEARELTLELVPAPANAGPGLRALEEDLRGILLSLEPGPGIEERDPGSGWSPRKDGRTG